MRNFKTTGKVCLVLAIFALLFAGIDLALYPATFMRNDVHALATGKTQDIILGTSHGKYNIDPEAMASITGHTGHNACVGGEYPIDAYYLLKLAIEKGQVQRVIYDVDPSYFVQTKEEGNNYLLFFHAFPLSLAKAAYFFDDIARTNRRSVLMPWFEYPLSTELPMVKSNLRKKLTGDYGIADFKTDLQEYHESGHLERYPVDIADMTWQEPVLFTEEALIPQNLTYLSKIIRLCQENDIEFIAVITPMPAVTLERYPEEYAATWQYFDDYLTKMGVTFFDFNTTYYGDYPHSIDRFTDYDGHMHGEAARAFSQVLASRIMGLTPSALTLEPMEEGVG